LTGSAETDGDIIQLEDIRKEYPTGGETVRALDGLSLTVRRGEFWAVMGPSGSGKSTLLNLLGCLDRPTAGRFILNRQDVSHLDDDELSRVRLHQLGFIFQSFNLIPQLTVQENIELPLYYLGLDDVEAARRARTLADRVGLGNRLHHRPNQLSGGQCQRTAIARALANNPALILADEPTGNLDTATGQQIMALLTELNREGRTILMVTHEPDIAACAGRRLYMRDGRVERIES
jgi:putative ABC transport system ATP-binding protein